MYIIPGKTQFFFLRTGASSAQAILTDSTQTETSFTGRRLGDGIEFKVPGDALIAEYLPATIKFKVKGETVMETVLEPEPSDNPGGEPVSDEHIINVVYPILIEVLGNMEQQLDIVRNDITTVRNSTEDLGAQLSAKSPLSYSPNRAKINGPVYPELSAVTIGAAVDTTTYNQAYNLQTYANAASAPVEFSDALLGNVAGYSVGVASSGNTVRTIRFILDGDRFAFYTGFALGLGAMIYADGQPLSLNPYALANANQFNTVVFTSAKPRLVEIRTAAPLLGLYTSKPYSMSRPAQAPGPRMLVMGDSFVQGVGSSLTINSIYHNIAPYIGINQVWVDGVGGTGYGVTSAANGTDGNNSYLDRLGPRTTPGTDVQWDIETIKPDIFVVHGGGINDLYKGRSVEQTINQANNLFSQAREKLPDAKLVFVEGFAPPGFTPATYNPNFIAIREGVQSNLTSTGVYYIDVATTSPWINGAGRVGATTGVGNSDIYIGADAAHPTDAGHAYLRTRLAERLRTVINDDGSRLNQLV